MTYPGTISSVRYGNKPRNKNTQKLYEGWFREQIYHYGVDVVYFRHNVAAFNTTSGNANFDYIFGEEPSKTYVLSANMVLFMESQGDSLLLNKFGIDIDGDMHAFILKEDFTEQFRDLVGKKLNMTDTKQLTGTIVSGIGNISADIIDEENGLDGTIIQNAEFFTSGIISGNFDGEFVRTPKAYNKQFYKSEYYTEQDVTANITGHWEGELDSELNGEVTGFIDFNLDYFSNNITSDADGGGPNWAISPKVGDFFRLDFNDDNHEEYEITSVKDRDLQADGINPLLQKYIWKMACVRRAPSHEEVIGVPGILNTDLTETGGSDREEFAKLYDDHKIEEISNEIFDYDIEPVDDIDSINSDDVYGGY